jgi:hypothetical protein
LLQLGSLRSEDFSRSVENFSCGNDSQGYRKYTLDQQHAKSVAGNPFQKRLKSMEAAFEFPLLLSLFAGLEKYSASFAGRKNLQHSQNERVT